VPWVKPCKGGNSGGIVPLNAATRHHYTGINVLFYGRREARTLTPPRNLLSSLRLHFCAPNSACKVNCRIAATSTAASRASQAATHVRSFSEHTQ
jgi:hypothetical protein